MSWLDKFFLTTNSGHVIQLGGVSLPSEPALNFVGVTVVDDPGNGRTTITFTGGGGGTSLPNGTYSKELLRWNSGTVQWEPASDGDVAASIVEAKDTGGLSLQGGKATGTLRMQAREAGGTAHTGIEIGYDSDSNGPTIGAYGNTPIVRPHVNGSTVVTKIDNLIAALGISNLGLVNDLGSTPGDGADYSGSFSTSSATTTTFLSIPLSDNTRYRIVCILGAADTTGNELENVSVKCFYRVNASAPTQLGSEQGPAPASTISNTTVHTDCVTMTVSSNNVNLGFVTVGAGHLNVVWRVYLISDPLNQAV